MIRVTKFRRKTNGYWYVRYWLGGRPLDESTRTKSESAAESYPVKREVEINAGIQPVRHADVGQLIEEYLELRAATASAKHLRETRRILAGFLRICGRRRKDGSSRLQTQQVSPATIDRYISRRQATQLYQGEQKNARGRRIVRSRPVSNVTLRKELRYLSAFFN